MQQVRDIFFDLDHTLWDFEKNSAYAFTHIFELCSVNVDINAFLEQYVPLNIKYWERYRTDSISQEDLRYGRLRDAFDNLHYEISDEQILILSDKYIEFLPKYNFLFDGALEVLEYLNERYRLHIITNGFHEIQNSKMRNSNILHFFQTITNSESAGVKKPNPLIFEHALSAANALREESLMIGDCPDADIQGAINCGFKAILFNTKNCVPCADVTEIKHLRDLKQLL